ncbi:expressed unknown protein [Seminavis robusta]|uniref:Uncharacterized protein n=1 Tax=Seminavis robusta TaxID=568900 RepID=A0A9N8HT43_9STRA|nr:expressed unknown protein [Seminavis robusta]|eukprot:Sro1233_g254750.1 n/a (839) ;mRNA; f:2837-5353
MGKPKGSTKPRPVKGQSDLLSCFRRQALRQKEETEARFSSEEKRQSKPMTSTSTSASISAGATSIKGQPVKSKRKGQNGDKERVALGKEKSMPKKNEETEDDVPLASLLLKRPKTHHAKTSSTSSSRVTSAPTVKPQRSKKIGSTVASNKPSKTRPATKTSSMDTALQFLDRNTKKRSQTDLTLKDVKKHTSKSRKMEAAKKENNTVCEETKSAEVVSTSTLDNASVKEIKQEALLTEETKETGSNPPDQDFQPTLRRSHNLVHQLVDRSVLGSRGRTIHDGHRLSQSLQVDRQKPALTAKHVSWIGLGNDVDSTQTKNIECMAWDSMGVLLAVAQTCNITKQGWIEIFDWDSVVAADLRARNARARALANNDKAKFRLDVPPLLQFRIPAVGDSTTAASSKKIPWIKWNPHNPDQLAVPSRCGSVVFCFNVSHIEAALASAPTNRIHSPPRHSYWEFKPIQTQHATASASLFVETDVILLAFGATLDCWRYYPKRDPTSVAPKLKWQYAFPFKKPSLLNRASVVTMEAIGKEHIIAGSSHGHFALIQWKRVVQAGASSAFSLTTATKRSTPTVVAFWLSHSSLSSSAGQQLIPPEHTQDPSIMGIHSIRVEPLSHHLQFVDESGNEANRNDTKSKRQSSNSYEQLCGRFRIQWITRCGWCLSVTLVASPSGQWQQYKVRRQAPRILHQTAPVHTKLASGGIVTTAKKEWSLPTEPVAADAGASFLCWQNVAPVTRILPHHDKRVLDEQPSLSRDVNNSNQLLLMLPKIPGNGQMPIVHQPNNTRTADTTTLLPLPKRRGLAKLVALDPTQEWVVIATNRESLYIVNLRPKLLLQITE